MRPNAHAESQMKSLMDAGRTRVELGPLLLPISKYRQGSQLMEEPGKTIPHSVPLSWPSKLVAY